MSIYDCKVKAQDGSEVSMEIYKGKVLLIVNTATHCGFTPHYDDLQALYSEYKDKGLEILDFPCNQFGNQVPEGDDEIHAFCSDRYGVTFPQFAKIDVNGEKAIPLFRWLTEHANFEGFDKNPMGLMLSQLLKKQDKDYKNNNSVKWNFTKFLISRDGKVVGRFEPTTSMKKVAAKVKEIL